MKDLVNSRNIVIAALLVVVVTLVFTGQSRNSEIKYRYDQLDKQRDSLLIELGDRDTKIKNLSDTLKTAKNNIDNYKLLKIDYKKLTDELEKGKAIIDNASVNYNIRLFTKYTKTGSN
jgi:hypothetical protein